jgi:hypothetical protein
MTTTTQTPNIPDPPDRPQEAVPYCYVYADRELIFKGAVIRTRAAE